MKKIMLALFFLALGTPIIMAQDIIDVIKNAPNNILLGLDEQQKRTFVSEALDTTTISINGPLGNKVERTAISKDYISIQTSESGTTQIKLLSLVNDSKIICVVKTVCGKMCDSRVNFYTSKWVAIDKEELFPEPTVDWFIQKDTDTDGQEFKNIGSMLILHPMKVSLHPADTKITVEYDIKNYLSEIDYKKVEPFLRKEVRTLSWDKVSFK